MISGFFMDAINGTPTPVRVRENTVPLVDRRDFFVFPPTVGAIFIKKQLAVGIMGILKTN